MTKHKKGFALLLILSLVMIAAILGGIVLNVTLNHFELTRHKVQRIQAYYAVMAGMNLAFERLRTGDWDGNNTYTLCKSGCTVNDIDIPFSVSINIINMHNIFELFLLFVFYFASISVF